jgi:hypothetical protein
MSVVTILPSTSTVTLGSAPGHFDSKSGHGLHPRASSYLGTIWSIWTEAPLALWTISLPSVRLSLWWAESPRRLPLPVIWHLPRGPDFCGSCYTYKAAKTLPNFFSSSWSQIVKKQMEEATWRSSWIEASGQGRFLPFSSNTGSWLSEKLVF